jgi:hypothetical protein|tara:strand:- start:293 stop:973 length:681 start_codon:yes stop_codon:yes gene_type:complete
MIELIFELLNNFIDWYQQFMGIPEGISYAIFGAKKKKRRAKRKIDAALKTIDELNTEGIGQDELGDPSNLGEAAFSPVDGGDPASVNDIPFKPDFPYVGRQIIIDSGRVHLNAKDDFLVLMSQKSISLSSQGSVNVDANASFIVNANRIRLGMDATEPLVLGNKLALLLNKLGKTLIQTKKVLNKPEDGQGTVLPEIKELVLLIATAAELLVKESLLITSNKNFTE